MINERSLFMQALEIDDPAERDRLLARECGDNSDLRHRIERLLAAHAAAGGILDKPAVEPQGTDAFQKITESVGAVIGPFKLIQQIGEGGMGVVYMAQQTEPVKRLVALKIIKPGMDTRQVIARFEAERQTLAMMDHPNIAKVLDAGTTDSGRPFFVMELVKGVPITQYCDTRKLTTRQRLELLLPVCQAVQHAHQKGVIHRDLKPSNVLIALYDGQPVPKVIDFGVAKATGGQLTEKTLVTGFGSLVGTLEYMSPEQAELNQLDVDTRSDIYSLGVLMYELLTGTTPFDRQRLRSAAFTEMLRIIREEEPPLPSTRLSTSDSLLSVAANRQIEPAKLSRLVRGEVDWIVMKALEKDRSRRYETANGLAQDIRRYLNDEAIIARPASTVYRLKKLVHRNRVAAGLIGTIATVLLLSSTISTWLAIRESRANRLARQSLVEADHQRQQAITAKVDAERQRDRAEQATQQEATQRKLAEERETEAKLAKVAELEQRQAAEQERDRANAANIEIARQKEQQRRALYAAQMNLISRAWDSNNIGRVRELLNATRPQPGESDLRDFEWHYWMRMLHASERELQLPVSNLLATRTFAFMRSQSDNHAPATFSHDGKYLATISRNRLTILHVWDAESGKKLFEKELDGVLFSEENTASRPAATENESIHLVHVDSQRVAVALLRTGRARPGGPVRIEPTAVLHVFQTNSGDEVLTRTAENYRQGPAPFAFTHDGARFATPLKDRFIQVCDSQSGEEIARVAMPQREGDGTVTAIFALDALGNRLAVKPDTSLLGGVEPYGVTIFDLETGAQVTTPAVYGQHLEFSQDGSTIVAVDRSEPRNIEPLVTAFDTATGRALMSLAKPNFKNSYAVEGESGTHRLSPNGEWLAVTLPTNSGLAAVQLWNTKTGKPGPKFQGSTQTLVALGFSSDGRQVTSIHDDGKVLFWGVPAQAAAIQATLPTGGPDQNRVMKIESPDSRWTAEFEFTAPSFDPSSSGRVFTNAGRSILLKDNTGQLADRMFSLESAVGRDAPQFSPNGAYLVWTGTDKSAEQNQAYELKVWEVASGREVITKRTPGIGARRLDSTVAAFSADSRLFSIALPDDRTSQANPELSVHVWELADGRQLHPRVGSEEMRATVTTPFQASLSFSRNGELLYKSMRSSRLRIKRTFRDNARQSSANNAPWNRVPGVQIWNVSDGKLVFDDPDAEIAIPCKDGSRMAVLLKASDGESQQIVNWDTNSKQEISRIRLRDDRLPYGIVVNADGRRLAATFGRNIFVYDMDNGNELCQLHTDAAELRAVAFNTDASRIVSVAGPLRTLSGPVFAGPASRPGEEQREVQVWDGLTGQELLSLTGNFVGQIGSGLVDEGALQLSTHSLSMSGGNTWNASSLSPALDADELANWLDVPDENGYPRTLDNVAERLNSATASEEVRRLALELVRVRRNPETLLTQARDLLLGESQSRKPYERALALITEAKELAPAEVPSLHVEAWSYLEALAHYRLGDWNAAAKSLSALTGLLAAKNQVLPAEIYILESIVQHHLGEREKALESLRQSYSAPSANKTHWQQFLRVAEEVLAVPKAADEPEKWLGMRVMPRSLGQLFSGNDRPASGASLPYLVTRIEEDRLWIGNNYIARKYAVPLKDAPAYYTNVLAYQSVTPPPLALVTQEGQSSPTTQSTDRDLYNYRGISWRHIGEPMKAIADYDRALKLQPDYHTTYSNIAMVYAYDLKEYDQALAKVDEAIRLRPDDAKRHQLRGYILSELGQLDEALKSYDESIRLAPHTGYTYCDRAYVWSAKGDREKMLHDLDQAIRLSPDDAFTWRDRAWLLATSPTAEHRDGTQAITAATKACDLTFWKNARTLEALAAAQAETNNFVEAIKWQEKALEITTKNNRPDFELRLALYREGKPYRRQPVAIKE